MDSSWCEVLVRSSDRMTQPGAPQQGVPAGRRPLPRESKELGAPPWTACGGEVLVRSLDRMTQPDSTAGGARGMSGHSDGRRQSGDHCPPDRLDRTASDRRSLRTFMEAISGVQGGHTALPRSDGDARIPPVPPGPLGDRDAPRGNKVCTMPIHPHTAADTPESLRFCLGRLGDRDAPWGYEETHTPSTPTQRRIHPSPSGPGWAPWGIGAPRGGMRSHAYHPPPHSGGYTPVPPVLVGPLGG